MALIEIRNLRVSFDGTPVLRGVNLNVEKGTTMVILGTSGAGKSVLLRSVIGLVAPEGGSICFDGTEIVGMQPDRLSAARKRMGYLFQTAALYDSMTVRENLAFALHRRERLGEEEIQERVAGGLRLVGLEGAIDKMPSQLSGGMRKRVGLARALVTKPELMLYDEPTTGLDPLTGREISHLIKDLGSKYEMTSIAVTHDLTCARLISDRVAVVHNGVVHVQGTLDDLEQSTDEFVKRFISAT
jgi:phospholipid/cholesterol/gamma-HCH transport system ATP-binding protein